MASADDNLRDDFIADTATNHTERRTILVQRIQLNWANKDIKKIERISEHGLEGWAAWFR
jgi:hypothetical protein